MRTPRLLTAWGGYPFALAVVVLATVALLPFRAVLHPAQLMLLYVALIVGVARVSGVRGSLVAAVAAFVAADLVFVPPYYHLTVSAPADWITLLVFVSVAVVSGLQTGQMLQRERAAIQREREIALLNRLSSRLVSEDSLDAMASFIVREVGAVFGADRAALFVRAAGEDVELLAFEGGEPGPTERALAAWAVRNDKAIALPTLDEVPFDIRPVAVAAGEAVPGLVADGAYVPLQTSDGLEGALYARSVSGAALHPEATRQMLAVANLAAAFLERRRLEEATAHAAALRESDRLKATLVSSVSHELKTPLAAVTARVTGLLAEGEPLDDNRVRSELEAASEDLGRLDSSIRDLLDVSRLESDAWRPTFGLYSLGEVLGTVAARIPVAQRQRVRFDVPEDLPSLRVDFGQWARAISNLTDNALLYSAATELVLVSARTVGDEIQLRVEDRGPGVPDPEKQRIFEKFYRGSASAASPGGTGLGLAIVREIVKSHGGRVWVEDAVPHGATFVITLPFEREER